MTPGHEPPAGPIGPWPPDAGEEETAPPADPGLDNVIPFRPRRADPPPARPVEPPPVGPGWVGVAPAWVGQAEVAPVDVGADGVPVDGDGADEAGPPPDGPHDGDGGSPDEEVSVPLTGAVLVTGTDTGVGKTVVTAAITATAVAAGLRVAVLKPAQTGTLDSEPGDVEEVVRLALPARAETLVRYPDPLAPLIAAREVDLPPLDFDDAVDAVQGLAKEYDLVLVEGAGGLLVPMGTRSDGEPWTVADLAVTIGATAVVVTRAGLGTLNHTALTLEALERRSVPAHLVVGAWPLEPELVHWTNLAEFLPRLVGVVPAGVGASPPGVFRRSAPTWFTPVLYGVIDDWRTWAENA